MAQLFHGLVPPWEDQKQQLGADFQITLPWGSTTPLHWDLLLPSGSLGICSPEFCTWLSSFYFQFHFAGWSHPLPWLETLFLGWQLPNIYLQPKIQTINSTYWFHKNLKKSTCPNGSCCLLQADSVPLPVLSLLIMIQTATWLFKPETAESSLTHLPSSIPKSTLPLNHLFIFHTFPSLLPISWLSPIISHLDGPTVS